jgi:hypothetical protein
VELGDLSPALQKRMILLRSDRPRYNILNQANLIHNFLPYLPVIRFNTIFLTMCNCHLRFLNEPFYSFLVSIVLIICPAIAILLVLMFHNMKCRVQFQTPLYVTVSVLLLFHIC